MKKHEKDLQVLVQYYYIVHKIVLDEHFAVINNIKNGGEAQMITPMRQAQVAPYIGIDPRTVRRYTDRGKLHTIDGIRGHKGRYSIIEVDRFIKEFLGR